MSDERTSRHLERKSFYVVRQSLSHQLTMTRDAEIPERPNVSRAPLVPRRTGAKGEEQETRENQNGGRTCALHVDTYRILTPVIRSVGLEQTNPVRLSVPGISPQSHVTPLS